MREGKFWNYLISKILLTSAKLEEQNKRNVICLYLLKRMLPVAYQKTQIGMKKRRRNTAAKTIEQAPVRY